MRSLARHFATAIILCLTLAGTTAAQTHPCDIAVTPNPSVASPVAVGFCVIPKDANGQPIAITGFTIQVGTQTLFNGPLNAIGVANAAGQFYFETPKTIILPKGSTSLVVNTNWSGGAVPSVPFAYVVQDLPPSPAVKIRIVGS